MKVRKFCFLLVVLVVLSSHDMFLKMSSYYLQPHTESTIHLYNGTFEKSDNSIDRNRMIDVSLVGNGLRVQVDTNQWTDDGKTTTLQFTTGEEGTWIAGVSTRARNIEMTAEDFNNYLVHDGVLDMLEWRKANNALDSAAVEKYSKHVKTFFQVGNKTSGDWRTKLGYPIEFIPLRNPYEATKGDTLQFQLLWKGLPLADQLVYVGSVHGHEHSHGHTHDDGEEHQHTNADQQRTDQDGIVSISLTQEGVWYLRTIHMVLSNEEGLTHESNWATVTFEIGHGHSHVSGNWLYWGLGIFVLLGLLFWLRRKGR